MRNGELQNKVRQLLPGVAVSALVAITAQFLAEYYTTPAMLLALLLGMAVSFLVRKATQFLA